MQRTPSDTREKSEEVEEEDAIRMRERKGRRRKKMPWKQNKERYFRSIS